MDTTGIIIQNSPYVVGWFTLSFINTGLAAALNRNRLIWFLLSLLLGPIATLLMALFGKSDGTSI